MQTMDDALRESQALDPHGFAIDAASIAKRKALDEALLKRLDALDPAVLSEQDRLFYDLIRWDLRINLEGYGLPQSQIPIHHFPQPGGGTRPEGRPPCQRQGGAFDGHFFFTESSAGAGSHFFSTTAVPGTMAVAWYQEHLI